MKTFRSKQGPFAERPFYSDEEIERTCSEELRGVDLYPATPAPVRIERFIEKRFGVSVEYADLGPGVLGFTRFGKAGVEQVVVSRALDEEGTVASERRVRSTLAHEAGHGLFHTHLFVLTGQCALFPEGNSDKPRVLCRDAQAGDRRGYKGEWWEYQANRAIGALLLPGGLVRSVIQEFKAPSGGLGLMTLPVESREACALRLAEVFDVNGVVARLRLDELEPLTKGGQPTL